MYVYIYFLFVPFSLVNESIWENNILYTGSFQFLVQLFIII